MYHSFLGLIGIKKKKKYGACALGQGCKVWVVGFGVWCMGYGVEGVGSGVGGVELGV